MPEVIGRSVYLSESSGAFPETLGTGGVPVFLSLNRTEEMDETWKERVIRFCGELNDHGCRVLADISRRTLKAMEVDTVKELRDLLNLLAVRIDYGFTADEIKDIREEVPVTLNASTITEKELLLLGDTTNLYAMHNFYPRPETGLDERYLKAQTMLCQRFKMPVLAFIPGTGNKRGPVYEGLPTLEAHRHINPLAAAADLKLNYGVNRIYVGDPEIDDVMEQRINRFLSEGILEIHARLEEGYEGLYDKILTNRVDSPKGLIRVAESREYSTSNGIHIPAENSAPRVRGTITADNENYPRYCGEVMITRKDYPADHRVNVIGTIAEADIPVLDMIGRSGQFVLIRE